MNYSLAAMRRFLFLSVCFVFVKMSSAQDCRLSSFPEVPFVGTSVVLGKNAQKMLSTLAAQIIENPSCSVRVTGYCASGKVAQQRSWDRVNAVIQYFVNKEGISPNRFLFVYGQEGGNCNFIDLEPTSSEDGPHTVPAPHPNYNRTPH